MITPEKLRVEVAKMDALMEAFGHTYLHFLDLGEDNMEERSRATFAFYALQELLLKIIAEAEELSEHMEVCDAILAIQNGRRE